MVRRFRLGAQILLDTFLAIFLLFRPRITSFRFEPARCVVFSGAISKSTSNISTERIRSRPSRLPIRLLEGHFRDPAIITFTSLAIGKDPQN